MRALRTGLALMVGAAMLLQGCTVPAPAARPGSTTPAAVSRTPAKAPPTRDFQYIVGRVEPVSEAICRAEAGQRNCDFRIILDSRAGLPPNAYQTLNSAGRPILVVHKSLLDQLKNADEIAFVLSHEAAHHISDHLERQRSSVMAGAIAAGTLAAATGASQSAIAAAQEMGAFVGSRTYSKGFELEADSLGAQIAYLAGYDPVSGVEYFARSRDPGDVFLGTHPPNAQRIEAVRKTMERLQ